jgi:hypothetical protein
LNVLTQINDTAGAASIPAALKYPQALAIMHPIRRPRITLVDFIMGEPKRSQRRMVMKTENPRPSLFVSRERANSGPED